MLKYNFKARSKLKSTEHSYFTTLVNNFIKPTPPQVDSTTTLPPPQPVGYTTAPQPQTTTPPELGVDNRKFTTPQYNVSETISHDTTQHNLHTTSQHTTSQHQPQPLYRQDLGPGSNVYVSRKPESSNCPSLQYPDVTRSPRLEPTMLHCEIFLPLSSQQSSKRGVKGYQGLDLNSSYTTTANGREGSSVQPMGEELETDIGEKCSKVQLPMTALGTN